MVWFIVGIIAVIAAVILFIVGRNVSKEYEGEGIGFKIGAAVALLAAGISIFFSMFYTQDPGEAKVLRSFTGEVVGQDLTAGADFKAPWVDLVDFDIRNQMVAYVGDGTQNFNGQAPNGPQITTQDAEGATVNLDVVINYSISPDAVSDIYANYQNQENFRARFIEQDVRSVVRDAPNAYGTLEVLTQRSQIATSIQTALEERWADRGVIVEAVALQEIRYSDEVRASFDAAQQARINVETAEANLAAAEVNAQQRIAEATAQAEANRLLAESLSEDVLAQRYLDTLEQVGQSGNLIVVPDGFNGILNLPGQTPTP